MQKDQIHHVNSIHNANEICKDLLDTMPLNEQSTTDSNDDSKSDPLQNNKSEEEKKQQILQERMQNTIDFLYDD